MNRNIYVLLCILAILLTSCNNSKPKDVSRNNHERIEKGEQEKWVVTDTLGNKQILDISNVMEKPQSMVSISEFRYMGDYVQDYQDHFYYMSVDEDEVYTIYKDHGKKVGNFRCDGYYLLGCTKYKERFYVKYQEKREELICGFGVIDFENKKIKPLHQTGNFRTSIYNDQVYYQYGNRVSVKDFAGNVVKTIVSPDENYIMSIDEKNLYYTTEDDRKEAIKVLCVDQDTGEKATVFQYERDESVPPFKSALLEKRRNAIYLEEYVGANATEFYSCLYIMTNKKKKMEMISSYVNAWEESDQYVFYTDKHHKIHRWNKKNGKEKAIGKIKADDIYCVADKLYIREYNEIMDEGIDEWDSRTDRAQQKIYTMDLNGKNMEKIAD